VTWRWRERGGPNPDSGLLVSWGEIDPGRQEQALLRLFSEVVAYGEKLLEEVASAASSRSGSVVAVSAV
jgi:hypothetical protein